MGILDLLFPKKCLGCGKTGGYFCSRCLNFVSLDRQTICPVCERPAIGGQTHQRCLTSYGLNGLTTVFAYKGLIKTAITKLKYRFVSNLAQDLVEIFLSLCGEDKIFSRFCQQEDVCLVPVPLHSQRKRWRGFNQAELLGQMIAANLGIKFSYDLLVRVKNTQSQTKLNEKERQANIKDAFGINKNSIRRIGGRNSKILLFDDVWTSGATLREAGKVLKQKGVKNVWGLTLAR